MKTIQLFLVFCGFAFFAFAGCASGVDGTIDYQLSGGFSGIHTSVHIDPDGAMTRTMQDGSKRTGQLDAATLDDLDHKIDQAGFSTLDREYGCLGCADDLVHVISVHVDGSQYTVKADDSANYPDRLRPLIETLRALVEELQP